MGGGKSDTLPPAWLPPRPPLFFREGVDRCVRLTFFREARVPRRGKGGIGGEPV